MPHFESYYSSPLARCTITANLTFGDIELPEDQPFVPTVKEGFREGMTVHTCNHRSSKTFIHNMVPALRFEEGFTEYDELWHADENETEEHFEHRAKEVLDDVFATDDGTWISVTAHSGAITKLLGALGHRPFRLATGQIIPVLVKAEVIDPTPTDEYVSYTPSATCKSPPITSNAASGCVCTPTPTVLGL
jgi:broad specificity phosphatase PhoE